MTDLQRRLVELYATGAVEAVHKSSAYKRLCREHESDRTFDRERGMIQELRENLDKRLESKSSYRDQVELSLRLLRRLKREQQEVCRELILLSYGRHWEDRQRSYFEERSLFAMQASDYFLSFTNRNPNKPNLNYINRDHEFFIKHVLGAKTYSHSDLSESNLVAAAVHYLLRNQQLEGFYYPSHEEDNTKVEEKLRIECGRAFVFVQLVQGEMFRHYEESRNWCHFEYTVARATGAKEVLFVQIDEQVRQEDVYTEFELWFQEFASGDPIRLALTRWYRPNLIDEARNKVSAKLAEQIRRASDRIYTQIPT